jgi:5-methylcytosine-specific restriction endonuclease McrA
MHIPHEMREAYNAYIKSERWHLLKAKKLKKVKYKCERCGSADRLSVHHLTYIHFGKEKLSELEVLCDTCHAQADREREINTIQKQKNRLFEARLAGWANKVYGRGKWDRDLVVNEFKYWLKSKMRK